MSNAILDAIGDVGYLMDTPGAYLRGALSGQLGNRASGEDMLQSWGVDAGPVGGMAAEMVADPLALAGLAGGAYKGFRGIQALTRAAQRSAQVDDLAHAGLRLNSGMRDNTAFSELMRGDDVVGHALSTARPGYPEALAHDNPAFRGALPEGAPLARFNEVGFFDAPFGSSSGSPYQGVGLGQQMMVDSLAQNPVEWLYNSQASPAAAAMYDRLKAKGLLDLTWDMGRFNETGGQHVMRLTDAGRAMAGTGGLVHQGVLTGEGTKPLSPLMRAMADFVGDENGRQMREFRG